MSVDGIFFARHIFSWQPIAGSPVFISSKILTFLKFDIAPPPPSGISTIKWKLQ